MAAEHQAPRAVAVPGGPASPGTLAGIGSALAGVMNSLQGADVQPTALQVTTITTAQNNARAVMARWAAIKGPELAALNTRLKAAKLAPVATS